VTEVFRFAALGLGAGALYAIAGIGLVLVYRGSGVVNFAQGAMGMVGAYVFFEVRQEHHLQAWFAVICGLAAAALLGALFHLLVMRRMHNASTLAKVVATLALLVVLQSLAQLRYGVLPKVVPSMLPIGPVDIFGAEIGRDRIYIFGIVLVLTAALWAIYKFTRFGVATSAVAENPRAAAALAVSPNLIAAANWAIGAALGALAAILLVPITSLGSTNITYLVIPVLAAAVVGRFDSFPITMLAGLVIGVAQSEITRYVTAPGWDTAVPFIMVAIVLLARGRSVAGKDEKFGRMPRLGSGALHPIGLLLGLVVALLCTWVLFPADWVSALEMQLLLGIILLSFVVVTGYAGQVSLVQVGFAGLGALATATLSTTYGWPWWLAVIGGAVAVIPVGIVVGLAGMRTRGVNLAILTLGLAISLEAVVFGNGKYVRKAYGRHPTSLTLFGIHIDAMGHPKRYTTVALFVFVLVGLVLTNLRRSRAGRRLIAVRTNERAAAALGVSVLGAKLYAFVIGGMVAAIGGTLLAYHDPVLNFGNFASLDSVTSLQNAVFGGVGTVAGPALGSTFLPDTLGQQIFGFLGSKVSLYLTLISGVGLLYVLTVVPDGLVMWSLRRWTQARGLAAARFPRLAPRQRPLSRARTRPANAGEHHRVAPKSLELRNVSVRFGGVVALKDLSLTVRPGEIVGLIGPNGAGKSTTIDAITGFVSSAHGEISLGGARIDGWSRERRARAGLGRSFQSLELFEDLTVRENLQTACDRRDPAAYATNLVLPDRSELTAAAWAAIDDFGLEAYLEVKVEDLDYAHRRTLAVARAVAGGHSILLLDEPAAGLSAAQTTNLSDALRRLADERGVGIFLVEHNVDMVLRTCDAVHALHFGVSIGAGSPAQIRRNPAVVEAYLGTSRFRDTDGVTRDVRSVSS
jgi:ABC-type branched-subunit amino acid transport system ATPase component/branched-subunit amino acid ABC-type transport system permease component